MERIARRTAQAIGVERELRSDEITLVDGYAGPAYGVPDEQTIEAIHLAARTEGMLTDPVYEGKSMAGLIGMVRSGEIPAGSRVLYAHLGGQPALSAYARTAGLGSSSVGRRSVGLTRSRQQHTQAFASGRGAGFRPAPRSRTDRARASRLPRSNGLDLVAPAPVSGWRR